MRVGGAGDHRHRARRQRHPAAVAAARSARRPPTAAHRRLASGMRELNAWHRATAFDDRHHAPQQRLVRFVPQPQAVVRDAADRRDMRRLGEHDAGAAHGARAEVLQVPVVAEPVGGAVLAHRRDHDAVAGGDRTESDRLKQQGRVGHSRWIPCERSSVHPSRVPYCDARSGAALSCREEQWLGC